jgi:hypothetical protein
MGSRWPPSDLQLATVDISSFVPLWHQCLCPTVAPMLVSHCCINACVPLLHQCLCPAVAPMLVSQPRRKVVKCAHLWLGCDSYSLLLADDCYKSLGRPGASQGSREMEITGQEIRAVGRVVHNLLS